jgi:hypothetical protein
MNRCQTIVFFIVVLIFVSGLEAKDTIDQAEANLNSAFVAVAQAEDAGADVTRLLERLEAAGNFLSEAHIAFKSGDYEAANQLAVECGNTIDGVANEAEQAKIIAERAGTDSLLFTAFWSGFCLILLVVLGIVVWIILKNRYFDLVLEMRPEV